MISATVITVKTVNHNNSHSRPAKSLLGMYLKKYERPAKKENNEVIND